MTLRLAQALDRHDGYVADSLLMGRILHQTEAGKLLDVMRLWGRCVGFRLGSTASLVDDVVVESFDQGPTSAVLVIDKSDDRVLVWVTNSDIFTEHSPESVRALFLRALAHYR